MSLAVLLSLFGVYAVGTYTAQAPVPHDLTPDLEKPVTIEFPCGMWEQVPVRTRLGALAGFGSFCVLIIQGLWNRAAPRWVALLCPISLGVMLEHTWWATYHCAARALLIAELIFLTMLCLMCIRHLFRPKNVTNDA
jgi:hypothetical protein